MLVTQLRPTLCEPMDYIPPGSSVHGILQASILEWIAIPFSRGSPEPGIELISPALQADSLPSKPPGKPCERLKRDQLLSSSLRKLGTSMGWPDAQDAWLVPAEAGRGRRAESTPEREQEMGCAWWRKTKETICEQSTTVCLFIFHQKINRGMRLWRQCCRILYVSLFLGQSLFAFLESVGCRVPRSEVV